MKKILYIEIKNYLLELLYKNQDDKNFMLPSEAKLVKKFNSSRYSVRNALSALEKDSCIIKVHGKGSFINPNYHFDLPYYKKDSICLVVPNIKTKYMQGIIAGINDYCAENFINLIIMISHYDVKEESRLIRTAYMICKGIIFFPTDNTSIDFHKNTDLHKFPIVLIDRELKGTNLSAVYTDNYSMMYNIIKKLKEKNIKNIGYLTVDDEISTSLADRLSGYTYAMDKFFNNDRPMLENKLSYNINEENINILKNFIINNKQLEAIIMNDSDLSKELVSICREYGISIGEHFIFVLIDEEHTEYYKAMNIPYFSVTQDSYHMGYKATEMLSEKIKNNAPLRQLKIPAFIDI